MTIPSLLIAIFALVGIVLIVALLSCLFFSIPLIEQEMQKGELSEDDLKLIEYTAAACGIEVERYVVRSSTVIHRKGNGYWNPLDPKTGHHFDVLLGVPGIWFVLTRMEELTAVSACIEKEVEGTAHKNMTPEHFCRVLCNTAAHFYNSTQRSAHELQH